MEVRLLKMTHTLERYCPTRVKGGIVKKDASCTKRDLQLLMENLYTDAIIAMDYHDAAPVYLMWHVFGCASILSLVFKQGLSVSTNNVLFLQLIRVKASEQQGLALIPDRKTFKTYPVHVVAVNLLMQSASCVSLLPQLVSQNNCVKPETASSILLLELLGGGFQAEAGIKQAEPLIFAISRAPGVHIYVNRIL